MIEHVTQDVRYAVRSFRATPLVALTIMATVGLGLGLVTVVFTLLNAIIFRADEVRNPHELFAVERHSTVNEEPEYFTRGQYNALIRETDVFSGSAAKTTDIDTWIDGRRLEGPLVTGNFFQLLGVAAARGRALAPADDEPGGNPVIVLSHRAWVVHFASDPAILNRTVLLNGARFHVVGVMPERFRGLTILAPDFWAPLSLVGHFDRRHQERADDVEVQIVGRLKTGLPRGQALAQLRVWDARRAAERSDERPATTLLLEPKDGTLPLSTDVLLNFMPLFFAFGLILMIGWANIANLLLARAVARQREIGIRLALGAARRRIIWQLLTESLLLALVSAAIAFGISRLVLHGAMYALATTWEAGFGNIRLAIPPADWRVALFLVMGAIVSTLFFALAPAFRATRLDLVRAMRGEVAADARPGYARNALVGLQVTGSALLLICCAVFLRTSWAAANVDPGFRTSDIVTVTILNEQRRAAVLDVLNSESSVVSIAATWPGVLGGSAAFAEPALKPASAATARASVKYQFVSPEYFDVLGIDLVRGRGFTQTERSPSAAVAIVSESVARELWPGIDAVGQVMRLASDPNAVSLFEGKKDPQATAGPPPLPGTVTIVGIARDVPGIRLGDIRVAGAGVYAPTSVEAAKTSLAIRVRGDSERVRYAIVDRLALIDPNMAEVSTFRAMARTVTYILGIPFWLTLVLGVLALLLTLSGLFSVLSYLVEQRTREIGVRMALGATKRSIGTFVLMQTARPVGIGLLLGSALAAALGAALLATPAAEQFGSIVNLFDPVAYAASLLCIFAACVCATLVPALRAGRTDPVAALRQY
jgi:predicted permease